MHHGCKSNRVFNGQARVQRGITVLEHHLGLSPIGFQGQGRATHALAIKNQLTSVLDDQLHEQARSGGFSTTGLAHYSQGLAFEDLKVHAIDGTHDATAFAEHVFFQREVFDQTTHTEHGLGWAAHIKGG